eukprot:612287-Amphidinium_carterae.3
MPPGQHFRSWRMSVTPYSHTHVVDLSAGKMSQGVLQSYNMAVSITQLLMSSTNKPGKPRFAHLTACGQKD